MPSAVLPPPVVFLHGALRPLAVLALPVVLPSWFAAPLPASKSFQTLRMVRFSFGRWCCAIPPELSAIFCYVNSKAWLLMGFGCTTEAAERLTGCSIIGAKPTSPAPAEAG